jgi:diguanylate cyclase (GGDEF)-like protein
LEGLPGESDMADPAKAALPGVEFECLDARGLEAFLARRRAVPVLTLPMSLADNLVAVLRKANEFVPSAAGSILLDNPTEKQSDRRHNQLTFIAAFGEKAPTLVGQRIPADRGIAGHVYQTGRAYHAGDVREDRFFYPGVDEETQYSTRSLVAIPIRIGQEVCGVLELINRRGAVEYSAQDRNLLEIFAGYISISIENVLDGRQAQEIAKRDNLTGLYNDRYLHIALRDAIRLAVEEGHDLAVLFLDLDFFKRVNDSHGHLAGSQVLRETGALLRRFSRREDAIVARYGGDEFVLALPRLGLTAAVNLAETIREEVLGATFCSQPGDIQLEPLHLTGLTCSIGVATLKRHLPAGLTADQSKSTLLRLADAAMYVAKETGRNQTAVAGRPVARGPVADRRRRADD